MDAAELAARSGVTVEDVEHLLALGILIPQAGVFVDSDISRVRLVAALRDSGIPTEDLARGVSERVLSLAFVEQSLARPVGLLGTTYRELADRIGLDGETYERIRTALGLSPAVDDQPAREDDAELLRLLSLAVGFGVTGEQSARAIRIFRDSLTRIAEFERELWATDIEAPLLAEGLSVGEMVERSNAMAIPLQELSDQTIRLLHGRALETVVFANQVDRLEEALDEAGIRRRGGRDAAIAFMDLSGYTRLTEESGDVAAADLSRRLAELVHDAAIDHDGRVVKMLGDGVMFHLRDPARAAVAGLELVERARDAGLPPARVGVNAGPVVVRDGDYFGRTVNVAARVVDKAGPTQVLTTAHVVEATATGGVGFTDAGTFELKGVAEPVPLFLASRS